MNKMDKNYYAVKKMTRGFQGKGKYYSQGEMKAMALIQNTDDNVNIVRYFQSWVEGGKSYLVVKNSNSLETKFQRWNTALPVSLNKSKKQVASMNLNSKKWSAMFLLASISYTKMISSILTLKLVNYCFLFEKT